MQAFSREHFVGPELFSKVISSRHLYIWGARQFVENHFADTTIGRIRLLVDATFRQVRHLVEKNSQVRHSVEHLIVDIN